MPGRREHHKAIKADSGHSAPRAGCSVGVSGADPDKEVVVETLIAAVRKEGLCGNCRNYERCRLPEKEAGGWRCSKYQPAGKV